jgi:uncharacterized membrane protein
MPVLRNKPHDHDPVWHVELMVLAVIVLQLILPDHFVFGIRWLLPLLDALLAVLLLATTPKEKAFRSITRRLNVVLLLSAIGIGNFYALLRVAGQLLQHGRVSNGRELILTAFNIYLTNIIVFALLYWEMDAGGPGSRRIAVELDRDFQFPQTGKEAFRGWHPTSLDYLYVSSTNAMAFSPTDTMPLSRRAKILMLGQSIVSIVVVTLVAARAVNILN